MLFILIVLVVFGIQNGNFESASDFYQDFLKLKSFEDDIKTSTQLDRSHRHMLVSWNERFQLQLVNVTVEYRVEMMRHRDHAFKTDVSEKWRDCVRTYRRNIKRMERNYNKLETECIQVAHTAGDAKRQAVAQLEKEIKKWRKGYRYLVNLCKSNYFSEEELASCIVQYVEKDNYNKTLQRLIVLKLKAMGELLIKLNEALSDLHECLRINLSEYLTDIRYLMKVLDRCYSGKKNE